MKKRTIAFGLASAAAGAYAATYVKKQLEKEENKRKLCDIKHTALQTFLRGFSSVLPDIDRVDAVDYDSPNFMAGNDKFITKAAKGAKWSLGFSKVSLLPDDIGIGEYFMGGYIHRPPNVIEDVVDDQMFRCVCINDGSGRGTAVFAVIDCVGISNTDIRIIRSMLKDFAEKNNIYSINISATHSHSCIDTQGLWGELGEALKKNPLKILRGETDNFISGRNEEFMKTLHEKAVNTIKEAFADMKQGKLYRATAEGSQFVRDKRPPFVTVDEITTVQFVPDDKDARSTRMIFLAAHPVAMGSDNKTLSGDFPYYIANALDESGENGLYFQGPEAAVTASRGGIIPEGLDKVGSIKAYGEAVAAYCQNLDKALYEEVEPILNIRITEVFLPITNYLYALIAKMQVVNNFAIKTGKKVSDLRFVTEIGYVEVGKNLKFALLPGEVMPEIVVGGAFGADEAYNRCTWDYPPLQDVVDGTLVGIGLCNDAIGYVVPDNDCGSVFAPLHYEESVSTGDHTASTLVKAFMHLVEEAKTLK